VPVNASKWGRPKYSATAAEAYLHYVLVGNFDLDVEIDRNRYNTEGLPDRFELSLDGDRNHVRQDSWPYIGKPWGDFAQRNADALNIVSTAQHQLTLQGHMPDPPSLEYLRDCIGVIAHFAERGGLLVFDPQLLLWYRVREWLDAVFAPMAPVPRVHVGIFVSGEAQRKSWVHTRGMRKFARPDISIRQVEPAWFDRATELCERFIEHQAFGMVVPAGQPINMSGLPAGLFAKYAGDLSDPDFNNVHIEITQRNSE
jgi:hypothetical protein